MKNLKIVHLCPYFSPQLGYEEYYLAYYQKKLGYDVYVITSTRLPPFKNIEKMLKDAGEQNPSRIREAGFKVIDGIKVYRQPVLIETLADFMIILGVKKLLKEINPDIVHGHGGKQGPTFWGALYKKELGYKFVCDSHDFYYADHPLVRKIRSLKDWIAKTDYIYFRKYLARYVYARADRLIAVTSACKDFMQEFVGADSQMIDIINLGADTDKFKFRPNGRSKVRTEYGLDDDQIVILFSGIITRRKSVEKLIEIFARLLQNHSNIRLFIVGDADHDYLNYLKETTRKLKVEDNVIFTGFKGREELPDYFSAADIGVWVSNNSLIFMEVGAIGLPMIIPDMQLSHVVDYGNGYKFQVGDFQACERYLKILIKDEKLRKSMGRKSREAVVKNYSYRSRADESIKIYQRLLQG